MLRYLFFNYNHLLHIINVYSAILKGVRLRFHFIYGKIYMKASPKTYMPILE